jgi:hypothetical protein
MSRKLSRRNFIKKTAIMAGTLGLAPSAAPSKILSPCIMVGEQNEFNATGRKLSFNREGKFKIVQFTDIHAIEKKGETDHAYDIMNRILDIEMPDLVIYTGDVVTTDQNPKAIWEKVANIPTSRGIPFAVALGNHDSDGRVPRDKIYEIVTGLKGCLNTPKKESIEEVYGYSNQVIPIYKSVNPDEKANIIYLFDSNDYHNLPDIAVKDDWIRSNQIEWYLNQSKALTKENMGKPYPALAFFHIPLHEYRFAATAPGAKIMGWRLDNGEGVGAYNSGLFSAFLECGDVKGVFVGHDHDNSYVVHHQGIALAYGHFSGGLNTYHALCRGARVIESTESEEVFDTWVRLETGRYLYRITVPHTFTSNDPKYRPYP